MGRKSNNEGSIFQTKEGKWISKIMDGKNEDGTPHIKSFSGKTRKEVVSKLDNYKIMMKNGLTKQSKITVAQYSDNWLDNVKSKTLVDTSFGSQKNIVTNHIVSNIGHFKMTDLTPMLIQVNVINKLQDEGYSYTLINRVYSILNEMLEYAMTQKHIETNWMKLVVMPNKNNFTTTKKYNIWNDEQIKIFLDECFRTSKTSGNLANYYGGLYALLLLTGMRIGEAIGLQWKNVDLDKKVVYIRQNAITSRYSQKEGTYKKEIIVHSRTKTTESNRVIPLCESAIKALEIIKKYNDNNITSKTTYAKEGFVVLTKNGNIPYPDNLLVGLNAITNRLNLGKCTLHMLRHNFGSTLFRHGIDIITVSKLMGHKSPSVTMSVYIDVLEQTKSNSVNIFDNF